MNGKNKLNVNSMRCHTVIFISFILVTSISYSCGRKPGNVLPREKMMDVLYDIQLAQAVYKNSSREFDSSQKKDALVEGVLQKYGITQAQLDTSLVWYSDNIEIYNEINDSVKSRLKAKSELLMNIKVAADISRRKMIDAFLPPYFYLTQSTPTFSFDLDSARIVDEKLLPFNFKFDVQGLTGVEQVEAGLFFTYKDTLVKQIIPVNRNSSYTFDTPQLPDSLLKSISGYVHMRDDKMSVHPLILIYNINYGNDPSRLNGQLIGSNNTLENNNPR